MPVSLQTFQELSYHEQVTKASQNCDPRPGKRRSISVGGASGSDQAQLVSVLRKTIQNNRVTPGLYAYIYYDPTNPIFQVGQPIPEFQREYWGVPNPPTVITQEIKNELDSQYELIFFPKTTGRQRVLPSGNRRWMYHRDARPRNRGTWQAGTAINPTDENQRCVTNYMVVRIDFEEETGGRHDDTINPPLVRPPYTESHNAIVDMTGVNDQTPYPSPLFTFVPRVDLTIEATDVAGTTGGLANCVPCDPPPAGETLCHEEEGHSIPVMWIWGIMPQSVPPITPEWFLTQQIARADKARAPQAGPMVLTTGGGAATWGSGGGSSFFRALLENDVNSSSSPVVECEYLDFPTETTCAQLSDDMVQCVAAGCNFIHETQSCTLNDLIPDNSCASVRCPGSSIKIPFATQIGSTTTDNCCYSGGERINCNYAGKWTCVAQDMCNWDDNTLSCSFRECNINDCGGDRVASSVSGTKPNCDCICKNGQPNSVGICRATTTPCNQLTFSQCKQEEIYDRCWWDHEAEHAACQEVIHPNPTPPACNTLNHSQCINMENDGRCHWDSVSNPGKCVSGPVPAGSKCEDVGLCTYTNVENRYNDDMWGFIDDLDDYPKCRRNQHWECMAASRGRDCANSYMADELGSTHSTCSYNILTGCSSNYNMTGFDISDNVTGCEVKSEYDGMCCTKDSGFRYYDRNQG